jgi:tripartite-type tricarboxylate transporter receptor subunit TctC
MHRHHKRNADTNERIMTAYHRALIVLQWVLLAGLPWAVNDVASAENNYPNRPVKIIVPAPPGGAADVLPRIVSEKLAARWNQPVIVENRPGAALNVGAEAVARAEPDGYTLLATAPGPLAIYQFIYANLRYEPSAFTPVTILASSPFVLAVGSSVESSDLSRFLALAKANPGKFTFGSTGVGSPPHLSGEMLKARAGIDLLHVPYKGMVPALTDLLGGRLDMVFVDLGSTLQHVMAGKVRVLGVGSDMQIPELVGVPAISETLPGFTATTWFAVVAPPKTPANIAGEASKAIAESLALPDVTKRFRDFHATPVGGSPAQTAAFFHGEVERWREVVAAAGIKQQ